MAMSRKVVLTQRPDGEPAESDFALVDAEIKLLEDGEVLLKVEHLSIDAFFRLLYMTLPGPAKSGILNRAS